MSLVSREQNNKKSSQFECAANRITLRKKDGQSILETIARVYNLICSFTSKQIRVLIKGLFGSNQ